MKSDVRNRMYALYGKAPPREKLLKGMAVREKLLKKQFDEDSQRRRQVRRAIEPAYRQLRKMAGPDAREVVSALAALHKIRRKKLIAPKPRKIADRVFGGSIGFTVGLPFDVDWTWGAQQGNGGISRSADDNSGTIALDVFPSDSAAGSVRGGVGVWLTAPLGNSTMQIWSTPSLSYNWAADATFDSCRSAGWIGLYIDSFDRQGTFIENKIDQKIPLWDCTASGVSWNSDSGSNSGYFLNAQFTAEEGEWYTVWVWCGAYAYQCGDHTIYSSFASSGLNLTVPSITWQNG
jgi:hypothetical protein